MTDPFDHDLDRLARQAPPAALSDLEHRVATAIAGAPPGGGGLSIPGVAIAGCAALALGLVGGGAVAGRIEAQARPRVALVALDSALAPSTLLLGR